MNKPVELGLPLYLEAPRKKEPPRKPKAERVLPEGASRVQKDSPEYFLLVEIFWGVRERVTSILDRVYLDKDGQLKVFWKKKHGGRLETEKISKRYHADV